MSLIDTKNFLTSLGGKSLVGTDKITLKKLAETIGAPIPKCNCGGQYNSLLLNLKSYYLNRNKEPKYKWVSKRHRFRFENLVLTPYTYDDDLIERYIELNPGQTDYELIKKKKKKDESKD